MDILNELNLTKEIKTRISEWLKEDYEEEVRNEIKKLITEKNEKELTDRFYMDLEFGTGGLRGVMGFGSNRMNKYNIWKTTQGLSNYLVKKYKQDIKAVIAYDSRNNSKEFALETALVFCGNNIKTYLFESLRPTPMLSFAVQYLQVQAGIVITASHNPPEYNGYKVYGQDGGQIVAPDDKKIIENVRQIVQLKDVKRITEEHAKEKHLLYYIGSEVDQAYLCKVKELSLNSEIIQEVNQDFKIVFTPLHGSGNLPVKKSLANFGFKHVYTVAEQELPDGNFSTVKSPNPEEPSSLVLGLQLCKEKNADILLATDPDSDRLGTAVRNHQGEYELLSGNQMVSLLTYYILSQLKEKKQLPKNGLIIKTIVTTDLMKKIADDFGVEIIEVLTGFKYIGEVIKINEELKKQKKPYKQYIFGGEESYGMLAGDFVRDKDAVGAASLFAEMSVYAKYHKKLVLDYLDEMYQQYGYYKETLKSLTLKGVEGHTKIKQIMDGFRKNPPQEIAGLKIKKIGDIQKGVLLNLETNKIEYKYNLPISDVLLLFLDDKVKVAMRPSGTEPKIKFYFSAHEEKIENLKEVKIIIDNKIEKVRDQFLIDVEKIMR